MDDKIKQMERRAQKEEERRAALEAEREKVDE